MITCFFNLKSSCLNYSDWQDHNSSYSMTPAIPNEVLFIVSQVFEVEITFLHGDNYISKWSSPFFT